MKFFKKIFKKKIVLPTFKKKVTLEEVGLMKRFSEPPYFRVLSDTLVLYLKSPIGVKERKFNLPLRSFEIIFISTKCSGNHKFWENLMIETLRNHWDKYESVL